MSFLSDYIHINLKMSIKGMRVQVHIKHLALGALQMTLYSLQHSEIDVGLCAQACFNNFET